MVKYVDAASYITQRGVPEIIICAEVHIPTFIGNKDMFIRIGMISNIVRERYSSLLSFQPASFP